MSDLSQTSDKQLEIDRVLSRLSQRGANQSTKPVLMVNIIEAMRGLNNGFPKNMYHSEHEARVAINEGQEDMLRGMGYDTRYVHKAYPKRLLRRNMNSKFAPTANLLFVEKNPSPDSFKGNEYVEEKEVANAAAEHALRNAKIPKGCGPWVEKLSDIPDIVDETEDQSSTIARLQGQLEEAQRKQTAPDAAKEQRRDHQRKEAA